MFKLFVLIIATCCIYQVISVDSNVNKQACLLDSSVNPTLVEKAYNGEISDARELKCYYKCIYENAGYINAKGEIQADKLKANIPSGSNKATANKVIEVCKNRKGKDACETAYLTQKCLLDNDIRYY